MSEQINKQKTYICTIEIGTKDLTTNVECDYDIVKAVIQNFVNELGECVKITPVEFIYTNGSEKGLSIQFIQYPRFPREESQILKRSMLLANSLMGTLNQQRCSIISPTYTYLLENPMYNKRQS